MMTSNLTRWLSVAVATIVLAACQGQNPVKSGSDLDKEYPNAAKVNAPTDGKRQPTPEKPDNTQHVCRDPFLVDIEGDQGAMAMTFTEEKKQSYVINVRNRFSDEFKTNWKGPKGSNLVDGKDGSFEFTWVPEKSKHDQKLELLQLSFSSPKTEKCGGGQVDINLITYRTRNLPTVSFSGLPTGVITFGDSVKFQVVVMDPGATVDERPTLSKPFIRGQAITSQNGKVDGSAATDCTRESPALGKEHGYIFECTFHSSALKEIRAGKRVDAVFYLKALSARSGQESAATPASISVQFEAVKATTKADEADVDADIADSDDSDSQTYGPNGSNSKSDSDSDADSDSDTQSHDELPKFGPKPGSKPKQGTKK